MGQVQRRAGLDSKQTWSNCPSKRPFPHGYVEGILGEVSATYSRWEHPQGGSAGLVAAQQRHAIRKSARPAVTQMCKLELAYKM